MGGAKTLTNNSSQIKIAPGLPSLAPSKEPIDFSWGFFVALAGGLLLLLTVWVSRPKH